MFKIEFTLWHMVKKNMSQIVLNTISNVILYVHLQLEFETFPTLFLQQQVFWPSKSNLVSQRIMCRKIKSIKITSHHTARLTRMSGPEKACIHSF